jgi:3-hydroxy acid dehydrogenase/malonic semialdehyde reductase
MSRKALVTGASAGIGRAICTGMLGRGWQVTGVARDPARAGFASDLYSGVSLDLADLDALEARLRSLPRELPPIDTVVLSAGRGLVGGLGELSYRQIREVLDLNLTSQVMVARAFWPQLQKKGGDLVLIGSECALAGRREGSIYTASKFALRGFAQSLRDEGARAGVRVILVNPGPVRTPFFEKLDIEPGDAKENALTAEDVAAATLHALEAPRSANFDEINLSPLKSVIRKKKRSTPQS